MAINMYRLKEGENINLPKPDFKMITFDLKKLKAQGKIPKHYNMKDLKEDKILFDKIKQELMDS